MRLVVTLGDGPASELAELELAEGGELSLESGELLQLGDATPGLATELEFVEPNVDGEYPWLSKVGTLLLAARAGHLDGIGVGEAANMTIELDNRKKQASRLLGRPIRARATVYDDADDLFFAGLIQSIDYGPLLRLTVEA